MSSISREHGRSTRVPFDRGEGFSLKEAAELAGKSETTIRSWNAAKGCWTRGWPTGQPFVIENRPGAATNLAAEMVVRADADGYTLLVITATNAVNASLYDNLKFNFVRDIAPVGGIAALPFILVVTLSFPAKTVPEFIAYAKANPGKVIMASTGRDIERHGGKVAINLFRKAIRQSRKPL